MPRKSPQLSVPERQQLKIARQSLRLESNFAQLLGMSHEQARDIIFNLTGSRISAPAGKPIRTDAYGTSSGRIPRVEEELRHYVAARTGGFYQATDYRVKFLAYAHRKRPAARTKTAGRAHESGRVRAFNPPGRQGVENEPLRRRVAISNGRRTGALVPSCWAGPWICLLVPMP